jgi:hypothetical protein
VIDPQTGRVVPYRQRGQVVSRRCPALMNGPSCPPSPSPKRRLDTLDIELPFPRVWISPRSRRDVVQSLRHSLVLNAITSGEDLIDDAVGEPTITNVRAAEGIDGV